MLEAITHSGTYIRPSILKRLATCTFMVVIGSGAARKSSRVWPRACGCSAALPGYTLAPDASLTQIVHALRAALAWFDTHASAHGIKGPIVLSGWSAGGHLAALLLGHRRVVAGLAISGVFELAPLRDSPHVNDKVQLTEVEIETLSPMRLPGVNKTLSIAYGTGELPVMIANSRDFHAHRARRSAGKSAAHRQPKPFHHSGCS